MTISGMIHGINPSIAKAVHFLNTVGYRTVDSHAGFYPGDPEEQEYWIQKEGLEKRLRKKISGPIVLVGVFIREPYIIIHADETELKHLKSNLPEYWTMEEMKVTKCENSNHRSSTLSYKHPKLLKFRDKFNEIYYELVEEMEMELEEILANENIDEINDDISKYLPLNKKEFNSIRDKGITELEDKLGSMVLDISRSKAKELADKYTRALNYYKK